MFPSGLFPSPLFPPGLFPGAGKSGSLTLFENELANFIRYQIGVNAYPNKLPQSITVYPLLSYTIFDGHNPLLLSGPCGMTYRGVQFDAYSTNMAQADNITQRLWLLFKSFRGQMGRIDVANVTRHQPKTFSYPPVNGGDGYTTYRYMTEYKFWFYE